MKSRDASLPFPKSPKKKDGRPATTHGADTLRGMSLDSSGSRADKRATMDGLRRRHPPQSTGCSPLHSIPVQLPVLRWLPRDPDAPLEVREATQARQKRQPLAELRAALPAAAPVRHRDEGLSTALSRVVRASRDRRKLDQKRRSAKCHEEHQKELMLNVVLRLQRALRNKYTHFAPPPASPPRKATDPTEDSPKSVRKLTDPKEEQHLDERRMALPDSAWASDFLSNALSKASASSKSHKPVSRDKRDPASELPLPLIDEVWDTMTRERNAHGMEHITTHLDVSNLVEMFENCRVAGMNIEFARLPGLWPARDEEPEDLSAGEVAHLCCMLLGDDDDHLTFDEVRKELAVVQEECRQTPFCDLFIGTDDCLSFHHFKRLVHFLQEIMGIDDTYILIMFQYVTTGHFEMPDLFAAMLMKELSNKRPNGFTVEAEVAAHFQKNHAYDRQRHPHTHQSHHSPTQRSRFRNDKDRVKAVAKGQFIGAVISSVQEVQEILDLQFTSVDLSRLCITCELIDVHLKKGIGFSRAAELFTQTVRHMSSIMKERFSMRPVVVMDRDKWSHALHRYDAHNFHGEAVKHEVNFAVGRTEFSVIIEALLCVMPKNLFHGVLDMCVKLLSRVRANIAHQVAVRSRLDGAGTRQDEHVASSQHRLATCSMLDT